MTAPRPRRFGRLTSIRPDRRSIRDRARRSAPFVGGIFAALIGVWIYAALNPPPPRITATDVRQTVDQTLASQTPPPPDSLLVYQAVRPSVVLIESSTADHAPGTEGVGTGVLIDEQGDILTALHVVDDATSITLTFSDGTKAPGLVQT